MRLSSFKKVIKSFFLRAIASISPNTTVSEANSLAGLIRSPKTYGVSFVNSRIPSNVQASNIYGAWICLENTSSFPWLTSSPEGQPTNVFIQFDGQVILTLPFPREEIQPGEQVDLYFSLQIPNVLGTHELVVDLVQQNVTRFSDQGVIPLKKILNITYDAPSETAELVTLAQRTNPWFYQPTGGICHSRDGTSLPVFVSKAKGCHIWDSQQRKYIDYVMGWGCCLLGYADHRVQSAIKNVLDTGAVTPFPYALEMEVAQMLTEDFPCAEMVVFGKNGSDICTVAARLARAHTGRKIILCSGYHGWQDFWVERMGFGSTGIPDRPKPLIHAFEFNDQDDFNRLYQIYRDDLAAVMLEPAGPAQTLQGHFQEADHNFLKEVAEKTQAAGALLIFDEIVTGYRYPTGSVQRATGVLPDLSCLGKAIAAGMPLSALVGRADIFQASMSKTHYGPTFKGEMYSFAAAKAAIEIYRTEPVADFVWDYGARLRHGINTICRDLNLKAQCLGPPFRMGLAFDEADREKLTLKRTLYYQELLKSGIITYNGIMLPSYAHNDAILQETLKAIKFSLEQVKMADHTESFSEHIEIPLL
jgi:glutamate-1-semialdehyde 2,1-aminomutase